MSHAELVASIRSGSGGGTAPTQPRASAPVAAPATTPAAPRPKASGGKKMTHAELIASLKASAPQSSVPTGPAAAEYVPPEPVTHDPVPAIVSSKPGDMRIEHQMKFSRDGHFKKRTNFSAGQSTTADFASKELQPIRFDKMETPEMIVLKNATTHSSDARKAKNFSTVENATGIAIPTFATESPHISTPMQSQSIASSAHASKHLFGEVYHDFVDGEADEAANDQISHRVAMDKDTECVSVKGAKLAMLESQALVPKLIDDVKAYEIGDPEKLPQDFINEFDHIYRGNRFADSDPNQKAPKVKPNFMTPAMRRAEEARLAAAEEEARKAAVKPTKKWGVRTVNRQNHLPVAKASTDKRVRATDRTDIGTVRHNFN